jgi:hypothetical protein
VAGVNSIGHYYPAINGIFGVRWLEAGQRIFAVTQLGIKEVMNYAFSERIAPGDAWWRDADG